MGVQEDSGMFISREVIIIAKCLKDKLSICSKDCHTHCTLLFQLASNRKLAASGFRDDKKSIFIVQCLQISNNYVCPVT